VCKCTICGKSLSTYNKEDICFCHQNMPKYEYISITKCGGFTSISDRGSQGRGFFPLPGDPRYNNIAFNKVYIKEEINICNQ